MPFSFKKALTLSRPFAISGIYAPPFYNLCK
nr:MAG TPA: hypothetical protein [Caudoviricetes sp.]